MGESRCSVLPVYALDVNYDSSAGVILGNTPWASSVSWCRVRKNGSLETHSDPRESKDPAVVKER